MRGSQDRKEFGMLDPQRVSFSSLDMNP